MSNQSRARAAAKATTGAKALPATGAKASMSSAVPSSPEPDAFLARWGILLAGVIIVFAALAAYHNSFSGPFIFDDQSAITDNSSIRQLGSALSPSSQATTYGRLVLNLTFALNYASGGMNVWGYHAFNLLVHMLAGLTLFGIVRRTLHERSTFNIQHPTSKSDGLSPTDALPLALAVAVIWVVHPLQTEAVTYISQRAESLMGLFYLLTLYCFVRGTDETGERQQARGERTEDTKSTSGSQRPVRRSLGEGGSTLSSRLWLFASIIACLLGVMSKEVIVTAPVMVLLYDRTFIAGSFRRAWQQRWRYYSGLAGLWLFLVRVMPSWRQHSVGFGQGVSWWNYALTSCRSVVLYLKLAIWPHPLVLDYGTDVIRHATLAVPYALVLAVLIAGTVVALRRWPAAGFAGAWFFVILAPASSVVPIAQQPMAEHRMYLSLAAVVVLAVLGLHRWIGRRSLILFAAIAVGLGWLGVRRNEDYHSALAIWEDTAEKCPGNARAHYNVGIFLMSLGRPQEAIAEYETAIRINPDYAEAHNNLGAALVQMPDRLPEAISHYETAIRIEPGNVEAHDNLGKALATIPGQLPEAIVQYETALRIDPDHAETHYNLGMALATIPGRLDEAISEYKAALQIKPDYAEAHNNLGIILATIPGRLPEAISEYEAALQIRPDLAQANNNLGIILAAIPGRLPEAITHYEAALKINPGSVAAHYNLGNALLEQGHYDAACEQFKAALQIKPDDPSILRGLATAQGLLLKSRDK
jgi:tetratricopeptide (TPR) repeat protein